MPELPDLTVYIEHLDRRVTGETLRDVRLASPFVLRTVAPTTEEVRDRAVAGLRRIAKQIVFELEGGFFVVIHLMVAGRLHWQDEAKPLPTRGRRRNVLVAFDFSSGTLIFTEAGRKRRASLRLVRGEDALAALDPGGLEVFDTDLDGFVRQLRESPPHPETHADRPEDSSPVSATPTPTRSCCTPGSLRSSAPAT